ncbi:MAG: hypothetical protein ABII12_04880 [Planctomycetota bacterium]
MIGVFLPVIRSTGPQSRRVFNDPVQVERIVEILETAGGAE